MSFIKNNKGFLLGVISAIVVLLFPTPESLSYEAHKTAGHKSKKFSHLIDDKNVSIRKKIFMTATERQFKGDSSDFLSMDDQDVYGDVIDQLSFKKALEQKPTILCDYKVITITVTKTEI